MEGTENHIATRPPDSVQLGGSKPLTALDRKRIVDRRYYLKKNGLPPDHQIRRTFRPGDECSACGNPIATRDDKHTYAIAHRLCLPGSNWREGDPCAICKEPVSTDERSGKLRTHKICQRAANRERERVALQDWRKKNPKHGQPANKPKPKQAQKTLIPVKPKVQPAAPVPAGELARMSQGVKITVLPPLPSFQETIAEDRSNGRPYSRSWKG